MDRGRKNLAWFRQCHHLGPQGHFAWCGTRAARLVSRRNRSLPNVLVFEPFAKNQKASWLANDSVPHSCTYTPDASRSPARRQEDEVEISALRVELPGIESAHGDGA